RPLIWTLLAIAYLGIRFGFTRQLDEIGAYTAYIMEVALVVIAIAIEGRTFFSRFAIRRAMALFFPLAALGGFAAFKLAGFSGISIPFDLSGAETLIFLLVVAPILEELVFRFFLWQPVESLTKKPVLALVVCAALFSYSHFHPIWFLPPELASFLTYQTAYTFVLGLACGYWVWRGRSLAGAILTHFFFNLGFYLASLA
ncbi:MAG: CPBP family intramembrane glutamic endopeptidase, partial [Bdellovibrionota bacterium]